MDVTTCAHICIRLCMYDHATYIYRNVRYFTYDDLNAYTKDTHMYVYVCDIYTYPQLEHKTFVAVVR